MSRFFINLETDATERYALSKFLRYTDNYDVLTSEFLNRLPELRSGGQVIVRGAEGRPDILSDRLYGNFEYWWILLAYNRMDDVDQIKEGMVIRYPLLSELEKLYYSLKSRESGQ